MMKFNRKTLPEFLLDFPGGHSPRSEAWQSRHPGHPGHARLPATSSLLATTPADHILHHFLHLLILLQQVLDFRVGLAAAVGNARNAAFFDEAGIFLFELGH